LGLGHVANSYSPTEIIGDHNVTDIAVGFYHSFIVTNDGTAFGFGRNHFGQLGDGTTTNRFVATLPVENSLVKKMSIGSSFSIMLKQNGSIYSFGSNVKFFHLK
jgi:alpha-tubulin suppressor-like RCC1 family protein